MRNILFIALVISACHVTAFGQLRERFSVSLDALTVLGISWVYDTIAVEMNGQPGTEYLVQVWTGEDNATGRTGWRIIVATPRGACDAGEITLPADRARIQFIDTDGDGRFELTHFFPENQTFESDDFDLSQCHG